MLEYNQSFWPRQQMLAEDGCILLMGIFNLWVGVWRVGLDIRKAIGLHIYKHAYSPASKKKQSKAKISSLLALTN